MNILKSELNFVVCVVAIELINSMQENYKNAGLNRLDEGTKICAESGVCLHLNHSLLF